MRRLKFVFALIPIPAAAQWPNAAVAARKLPCSARIRSCVPSSPSMLTLTRVMPASAIARAVAKLDQVRLDRCRLASFVGGVSVEVRRASFANVTALYLQHNRLTSTRGVDGETLPRPRFLALQGNRLRAVAELGVAADEWRREPLDAALRELAAFGAGANYLAHLARLIAERDY